MNSRRVAIRIVIGLVLTAGIYGMMLAFFSYQTHEREHRIARKIESAGGLVRFRSHQPDWIAKPIRDKLQYFDRIRFVTLNGEAVPPDLLAELGALVCLEALSLDNTEVDDAGLAELKGLSKLKRLALDSTKVTDVGLNHLVNMANLERLDVNNDQVTANGRSSLRIALPNCEINPEP